MMTTANEAPQTLLTGPDKHVAVPKWMAAFSPVVANEREVKKLTRVEYCIGIGLLDPYPDPVCSAVVCSWPSHYVR